MVPCSIILVMFSCLTAVTSNLDVKNFCKTSQGDIGKCINATQCPNSREECAQGMVCCPMMGKIITPNSSPNPITQTSAPIISVTSPRPEITTKVITGAASNAAIKCEEYKHRVKKRTSIITYVFGGSATTGREFPHMAVLGYGNAEQIEWLCGGSLISDRFVVTAAHCLVNTNLGQLSTVRLGELDLQSITDDARPEDYGIEQKIIHPNYSPPSLYDDIALIKLNRQVQFNDYISPICLQINRNLANTNFIATGWGRTEFSTAQSNILLKVNLEYYPFDLCRRNYAGISPAYLSKGIVDATQICAGSHEEDKDTCQGDSGGPLQIRDDAYYLVGITSFGKVCGLANSPGVYTRISYYVPWIEQTVWA